MRHYTKAVPAGLWVDVVDEMRKAAGAEPGTGPTHGLEIVVALHGVSGKESEAIGDVKVGRCANLKA